MKQIFIVVFLLNSVIGFSQKNSENNRVKPFIAYDFGQAIFNKFQSLSGEVGLRLQNHHLIRLTHMNVRFTEEHLSSKKAIPFIAPYEGGNIEGSIFGFELMYSIPVVKWKDYKKAFYLSPSLGHYKKKYWHTNLDERLENSSFLVGLEISYRETNVFGIKGLYYALTLPLRFNFAPHKETYLGNTKILGDRIDSNTMFFVGFEF